MLDHAYMRCFHIAESIRDNGIRFVIKETVYRNRIAVVVMKDLKPGLQDKPLPVIQEHSCVPITADMMQPRGLINEYRSRHLKGIQYLKKGYRGFGLVVGNEVVADLWYYLPTEGKPAKMPKDLGWLGISCSDKCAYSFDMFLNPKLRGQNLAAHMQKGLLQHLRHQGVDRVYGYYWLDNLPALWVHRMLRWKEIKRLRVNRFLALKTSHIIIPHD